MIVVSLILVCAYCCSLCRSVCIALQHHRHSIGWIEPVRSCPCCIVRSQSAKANRSPLLLFVHHPARTHRIWRQPRRSTPRPVPRSRSVSVPLWRRSKLIPSSNGPSAVSRLVSPVSRREGGANPAQGGDLMGCPVAAPGMWSSSWSGSLLRP